MTDCMLQAPEGRHVEARFEGRFGLQSTRLGVCEHWVELRGSEDMSEPGPR